MILGYSIIGASTSVSSWVCSPRSSCPVSRLPIWLTILVGIVAATIRNYVATLLGVAVTRFDWIRHGLQLPFAIIGIGALAGVYAEGHS